MDEIREKLIEFCKDNFGVQVEPEVTVAPENFDADFSSNIAMKLARELKKNPREIAEEIRDGVSTDYQVEVAGPGFLNFRLSDEYFLDKMAKLGENFEKNISPDEYLDKTVICEFSDPNPFKVLHVGHLYTSVVGDAISKLFELSGAKVVRANFGGDVGLHVAKTIFALLYSKEARFQPTFPSRATLSSLVVTGSGRSSSVVTSGGPSKKISARELVDNLTIDMISEAYIEGTKAYDEDPEAKKKITELNKEIYRINKEDIHEGEVAEVYWKGRELSYQYFDDFYAKIGLKFDKYYPESTVADLGLKTVKEQCEKGVYEVSDGAVVFKGEKFGLHTRVFINKEGVPTYEAKDVGLIFTKWDDYHFDKSVVITGNEQQDYMKVVLKSIEQYAPDLVEKTSHLTHGMVKLPGNVKMSSRKGNFLKAVDVIGVTAESMKGSRTVKYDDLSENDKKIVLASIKYAFLKYKVGGDIVFDPGESVKMVGNSGPYLLYSTVRARKILKNVSNIKDVDEKYSLNEFEKNLIKKIDQYNGILDEAALEMAPHKVCNYLYELAQEFSRFYENCPVVGNKEEGKRKKIVQLFLKTLEHGLDILGIEVPDEM